MCSAVFRIGTIESVISNYGRIHFDDDSTLSEAFFDLESVGNAADDLTDHFKKGMKVKAKTKEVESGDARLKAYSVMLVDSDDPAIRGGDIYLKKLLERIGPQVLDSLPKIFTDQPGNCPKFLKSNKIDGIKKVVLSRPDWFKITDELHLIVIPFEEIAQSTLLSILRKQISISITDFESTLSQYKKINGYLTTSNLINFVSRHADSIVLWKDSLWSCESLFEDTEDGKQFQNDMMAVKYYSQFISKDAKVTVNVMRGHYSQAPKIVQQAVKSKDPDFRLFWKRNNFFFNIDEDIVSCYFYRLPILDLYWSRQVAQSQTVISSPANTSDAAASIKNPISRSDSTHLCPSSNEQVEDLIKKHLELDGAINLVDFNHTDKSDVGCQSDGLKQLGVDDLRQVAESCPSIFSIKNEYLCLNFQENMCIAKMDDFIELSPHTVADLKLKFESDPEIARYIFNGRSEKGLYDFVSRNPDHFLFWKNSIYLCKQIFEDSDKKECFEAEIRAVQYYAKFIKKNSSTPIVSVRGHYAQATDEIRNVAHSRHQDFVEFLTRNEFFFEVSDDSVKMTEKHFRNLSLIDKWLDPGFREKSASLPVKQPSLSQSKTNQVNGNSSNGDSEFKMSEESTESTLTEDAQDVGFPVQESRAFIEDIPSKIPILAEEPPLSDANFVTLKNDALFQHSILNEPLSTQDFGTDETFQRILGDELCNALRERLSLENDVNNLILLRLHVGAPMRARFWDAVSKSYTKVTIGTKAVEQVDVNRVLRSANVIKVADGQHYGIEGTLHTINVMEQHGEVCEVTIFYQRHAHSDGLMLDIKNGQSLQAVFPGQYPDKWIYNFLRSKSKKLSESKDVLVLDMHGKMSGCDEKPHSSLGDVIRIMCTESNLTSKILDAIPRKQQYVIIIGVDSVEQFEAVEKMCGKGIEVIAEVSKSLKSRVKQLL